MCRFSRLHRQYLPEERNLDRTSVPTKENKQWTSSLLKCGKCCWSSFRVKQSLTFADVKKAWGAIESLGSYLSDLRKYLSVRSQLQYSCRTCAVGSAVWSQQHAWCSAKLPRSRLESAPKSSWFHVQSATAPFQQVDGSAAASTLEAMPGKLWDWYDAVVVLVLLSWAREFANPTLACLFMSHSRGSISWRLWWQRIRCCFVLCNRPNPNRIRCICKSVTHCNLCLCREWWILHLHWSSGELVLDWVSWWLIIALLQQNQFCCGFCRCLQFDSEALPVSLWFGLRCTGLSDSLGGFVF